MEDGMCRSCFQIRLELERYIMEHEKREQVMIELQERCENLKHKNAIEKKKHSEINNEIIMSNVRYQQALSKVQASMEKYVKEREDFLRVISSKDVEAANLKARVDTLEDNNQQLYTLLKFKQNSPDPKGKKDPPASSVVTDLPKPEESTSKLEEISNTSPEKTLNTPSIQPEKVEDNTCKQGAIKANKAEVDRSRGEADKTHERTRYASDKLKEKLVKKDKVEEKRIRVRYTLRQEPKVNYAEPSLKKKLRQEYTDPIIIKAVDDLLVPRRATKVGVPTHDDKENLNPQY